MNYNFTDRVRKVLAMAREEAVRLQHDYVGTEHILLGLIREGDGVAELEGGAGRGRDAAGQSGGADHELSALEVVRLVKAQPA